MTEAQEGIYWRLWAAACSAQGWNLLKSKEKDQYRYAVHALACGKPVLEGEQPVKISSKKLTNAQITRAWNIMERLARESFREVADDQAAQDPSLEKRIEMTTSIQRMAEMVQWLRDPRLCGFDERREAAEQYLAAISMDLGMMAEWRRLPLELKTHQDMRNLFMIIKGRLRDAIKDAGGPGAITRTNSRESIDHVVQRVIYHGPWQPIVPRVVLDPQPKPESAPV